MTSYAFTILLSAFLLFQIQPLIGKHILPWFGGSPAVWTTCLLFFQVALLGGYAYAYWVAGWKRRRMQFLVHFLVLGCTLFFMPVTPNEAWKPEGGEIPIWRILGLLTVTVGSPYFLLSTTGPLLQAWYSKTHLGKSPYRLYAISNTGSLLGLITYPFFFEPLLTRQTQAFAWSGAYATFVLACGWCAWQFARATPHRHSSRLFHSVSDISPELNNRILKINTFQQGTHNVPSENSGENPTQIEYSARAPGFGTVLSWLLMTTVGSALLLSSTNQMCQNVAAVPFLWVLPLSLYLVTFIIAFEGRNLYRRVWCMPLFAVSSALSCLVLRYGTDIPIQLQIMVYTIALFTGCMSCHGELARHKPNPKYLTLFYLAVASGGALGGIFVALAAPFLFPSYWEYHISIGGVAALILIVLFFDPQSKLYNGKPLWAWIVLFSSYAGLIAGLMNAINYEEYGSIAGSRSFHGVLHITEWEDEKKGSFREMYHGLVIHGMQYTEKPWRHQPTTYYGKETGVWLAVNNHPKRISKEPVRIGVIGLGTGTIAALANSRDVIRFYEINPDVIKMSEQWFWYRKDSPGHVEIVLGDARIQLERELESGQDQQFDVLVADAFSSEAIPLHLLTLESAEVYRNHLKKDGILAIHISNDYLNLVPITLGLAKTLGWEAIIVDSDENGDEGIYEATWVLITSNRSFLNSPQVLEARLKWQDALPSPRIWTDDYASLLHVMQF